MLRKYKLQWGKRVGGSTSTYAKKVPVGKMVDYSVKRTKGIEFPWMLMFGRSLCINKLSFTLNLYLLVVSRPITLKSSKEASGLHVRIWSLTVVEFWPLSGLPDSAEMPKCSLYLLLAWRIDSPTYVELHLLHVYLYTMPEVR